MCQLGCRYNQSSLYSGWLTDEPAKIAKPTIFQVVNAGYWEKFSTSNNHASVGPHWLWYYHCAKLIGQTRPALTYTKFNTRASSSLITKLTRRLISKHHYIFPSTNVTLNNPDNIHVPNQSNKHNMYKYGPHFHDNTMAVFCIFHSCTTVAISSLEQQSKQTTGIV